MIIQLLSVAKNTPQWVTSGYQEYAKRLQAYCQLELIEIPLGARSKSQSIEKSIAQEGAAMLQKLKKPSTVIALDVRGQSWDTPQLAAKLEHWRDEAQDISLLIGGPDGLAPDCLARADVKWSLSALTFPHPLVRVILAEQLYRAFSLLASHPYHRA